MLLGYGALITAFKPGFEFFNLESLMFFFVVTSLYKRCIYGETKSENDTETEARVL